MQNDDEDPDLPIFLSSWTFPNCSAIALIIHEEI